jgi:uncharacterized MAPEG superfamily protein
MILRIFTGASSPATTEDPIIIRTLNRIIQNTLEQSVIFVGLYLPYLLDIGTKAGSIRLLALISLFIVGRLIFAIGYILGACTNISSFRSLGFSINLIVNMLLASNYFKLNLFPFIDLSGDIIFGKIGAAP